MPVKHRIVQAIRICNFSTINFIELYTESTQGKIVFMKSKTEIIENMKNAGCCDEDIRQLEELYQSGNVSKIMKLLDNCRSKILDQLHEDQRKIDCLDYLMYTINRN